jgi:transposase
MEGMNQAIETGSEGSGEPRRPEGRSGLPEGTANEVALPQRRRFTREYKMRILAEADRCRKPGEIGMLLRREGLHSSHLVAWRKLRQKLAVKAPAIKRGRPAVPVNPLAAENARLQRINARLELRLRKVEGLLELQKKASEILGIELPPNDLDETD